MANLSAPLRDLPPVTQDVKANVKMNSICKCQNCKTDTVTQLRKNDNGAQIWHCNKCREVKHWCVFCDQGWVRDGRLSGLEFYVCFECDALWKSVDEIGKNCTTFDSLINEIGIKHPWKKIQWITDKL